MTILLQYLNYTSFNISDVVCRSGSVIATAQIDIADVNSNTNVQNDLDDAAQVPAVAATLSTNFRTVASSVIGVC